MSDPFIGEIRMFAGTFAPYGWLFCDGTTYPIQAYQPLAAVIGTIYGNTGINTFKVPDLRDKVPMHHGQGIGLTNRVIGAAGGAATVALNLAQMPTHTHNVMCKNAPPTADVKTNPANNVWGACSKPIYGSASTNLVAMSGGAVGSTGTVTPVAHNNIQPYLTIGFIIAWNGVWPERP